MASTSVLESMTPAGHENVVFGRDDATGLRAIIAVHSTALGPALGGTRMHPYASEEDALTDVLRLSEGMTFKAAAAGLDLGGGKAVIIADPATDKTPELLHAYGRMVDRLRGSYITAEDVGTTVPDLVEVGTETRWVTGLPTEVGGSGDPSPFTARGVVAAMRAVSRRLWSTTDLTGRTVCIQGAGKVGAHLARILVDLEAAVSIADIDSDAARSVALETGAELVSADDILSTECDILAPCAMGGVMNAHTIADLRCRAVVGSANNQLAETADAGRLARRGIVFAPDYVVNAGGIINIAFEVSASYDALRAARAVDSIEDRTSQILEEAERNDISPTQAAGRLARARIEDATGT